MLGIQSTDVLEDFRKLRRAVEDLPADLRRDLDAWDPAGTARFIFASPLADSVNAAGRKAYAGQPPAWAALEDKVLIDGFGMPSVCGVRARGSSPPNTTRSGPRKTHSRSPSRRYVGHARQGAGRQLRARRFARPTPSICLASPRATRSPALDRCVAVRVSGYRGTARPLPGKRAPPPDRTCAARHSRSGRNRRAVHRHSVVRGGQRAEAVVRARPRPHQRRALHDRRRRRGALHRRADVVRRARTSAVQIAPLSVHSNVAPSDMLIRLALRPDRQPCPFTAYGCPNLNGRSQRLAAEAQRSAGQRAVNLSTRFAVG